MSLPRSAALGIWLSSCLRGRVGPDDFAEAVRSGDPQHLVVGWPGADGPVSLEAVPALARSAAVIRVGVAVPIPGDPVGLAGPAPFNVEAVAAGEAVVLTAATTAATVGLVPQVDARTVLWHVEPAAAAPLLDAEEAARTLRQTLVTKTAELVRLDVAAWQPEIPDLLMNLRDRAELVLPPGTAPNTVEALERAVLCRQIVDLALESGGGSVTAHEIEARRRCLTDLDRAARRALAALCSDSLAES